jgi:DNA-directed RNA polymerase II subunit RPB1
MSEMIQSRNTLRTLQQRSNELEYNTLNKKFMLPVNFKRINGEYFKSESLTSGSTLAIMDPMYIMDEINRILKPENTPLVYMTCAEKKDNTCIKYRDEVMYKLSLRTKLMEFLAPKKCCFVYRLSKQKFDDIVRDIIKDYNKSMAEPDEMVGVIAAQSLGEPSTQLTLNTFHKAGLGAKGTGMLGIRRIKELLNCTKNSQAPMMSIYIDGSVKDSKQYSKKIASFIEYTDLFTMTHMTQIIYDPILDSSTSTLTDPVGKPWFIKGDESMFNVPWALRVCLDKSKLTHSDIIIMDLRTKLVEFWGTRGNVAQLKRSEKSMIDKVTNLAVLITNDAVDVPCMHVRYNMSEFNKKNMLEFREFILYSVRQKGIEGIESISDISEAQVYDFSAPDGKAEIKKHHVIYTNGVNLIKLRNLRGIDVQKTTSNNIVSIYRTHGIEAVRNVLVREFIIPFKGGGERVNYHHISVLVDHMTHTGELTSIARHFINKLPTGPLSRASFEKNMDTLGQAVLYGQKDELDSVSSRVMTGKVIKGGTGLCRLTFDASILEKSELVESSHDSYDVDFNKIKEISLIDDIMKQQIDNYIPDKHQ